jgi:signal transduction histidine kinase
MSEPLWEEIRRYVDFGPRDEEVLQSLLPLVTPHIPAVVDEFYRRILEHPGARASISGGSAQVERLKGSLASWLTRMFTGPYDETYYEARARIGRRHVQIALPQQYMFTAVNVIRVELSNRLAQATADRNTLQQQQSALNKMMDLELTVMLHTYREDYMAAAQRNERLATFGQLVASIGHELRNPLGVMESSLYLLRTRLPLDERITRHLDRIQDQIKVSNRIITDLLDMVRDRPADRRPIPLTDILAAAREQTPRLTHQHYTEVLATNLPPVTVDANQVRQVFTNLFVNGLDAPVDTPPRIHVDARAQGTGVAVRVMDNGPGVPEDVRARLFEPLVTTKARGVGLGLALCKKLVERNGGRISLLANGTLGGAVFEVWLPGGGETA